MIRNIDTTVIRAFLAVVDTGSVTLAARQLNLSQGAISQQIRRLEELSKSPLFMRVARRMALTPEGKRMIPAARKFLSANDTLYAALSEPAFTGEVRFGAPYDIMGSYAPGVLRGFSAAFPNIRVTLICRDTVVLIDDLKAGKLDVALTTERQCRRGGEILRSDRLVWTGARSGNACAKAPLPVSLGAETCVYRPVAIAALRKARRDWEVVCEVSNMEPVRATLEADLAIAPLLSHSVPESLEIIEDRRRLPKLPMFHINLYEAEQSNAAVHAFANHVRRSVARN
ncbi:MAG: LysR family transcriptional regulator [Hyphomicrobiaceae bacterium]